MVCGVWGFFFNSYRFCISDLDVKILAEQFPWNGDSLPLWKYCLLFVLALHWYLGGMTCVVEKERSGIRCAERNCVLWGCIFHMSFSLSRYLFILLFISIAHGFVLSQAKTKYWLSLHVSHLAVLSLKWCFEEKCWVGIGGTLQGGVKCLYLLLNTWKAASSLTALQKNSDHVMNLPMKSHIPNEQKISGSVEDTSW